MVMNATNLRQMAEAISIFFPVPGQERLAVRISHILAEVAPEYAVSLRPETTLAQMFIWAERSRADAVQFVDRLEHELGFELDEFLDEFDHTTFRELIEHAARHKYQAG